jgi:hypothetical protein
MEVSIVPLAMYGALVAVLKISPLFERIVSFVLPQQPSEVLTWRPS